jgi:hypothetical protein
MMRSSLLMFVCSALSCDADPVSLSHAKPAASVSKQSTTVSKQPAGEEDNIFGQPDEPLRSILATAQLENVSKGSGGRSLAFKLTFKDDVQGFFKPEQTFAANWYSELASYYLDRELGLGRVPPAIGRRIEWEQLRPHAAGDRRIDEAVVRGGTVRGSVVWWIPTVLEPVALPAGWESWLRVESASYPSPFERPEIYLAQRRRGVKSPIPRAEEPKFVDRAAELSDLIVFDYLIDNVDRWGGGFTNVRTLGRDGALIYLDNANGFAPRRKASEVSEARLKFVQRFRRSTIEAIRRLDVPSLERRMSSDPLAPLLSETQLRDLDVRRGKLLTHIAQVQKVHGSHAMPW